MRTTLRVVSLLVAALTIGSVGTSPAQVEPTISDTDMRLVDFEDLAYPAVALTAHIQGVVVVYAKLDDQGRVVQASAISGAEPLISASLANARKWRFRPNARKAAVILYNFRLTDAVSKSGCSHFALQAPNFATITGCLPEVQ